MRLVRKLFGRSILIPWSSAGQRFAAVILVSSSLCAQSDGRQSDKSFERWAKAQALPLKTVEAGSSLEDLRRFKQLIVASAVIGPEIRLKRFLFLRSGQRSALYYIVFDYLI